MGASTIEERSVNIALGNLLQASGGWADALTGVSDIALQAGTLLLSFTLAILVLLVFAVRLLLIARGRPVPTDPFDMAKPRDFRTLMVVAAALLAPLATRSFLPVDDADQGQVLLLAYTFEGMLAVLLWLLLEAFYRVRARRRG
jgi:hypothetical protein